MTVSIIQPRKYLYNHKKLSFQVIHLSSSRSHDVPLMKLSALHNESLIYIVYTSCYNERIRELAELGTWQKLSILRGEWTFEALHNTNTHWSVCQICFANIRWGPLVSRSQTFRLTAEGLGTLAALNGQGPPKRPYDWQVKQPITFRFVPRHVSGSGNVATITDRWVKLSDIF